MSTYVVNSSMNKTRPVVGRCTETRCHLRHWGPPTVPLQLQVLLHQNRFVVVVVAAEKTRAGSSDDVVGGADDCRHLEPDFQVVYLQLIR